MKRLFYLMLLLVLPFFIYGQTGYYIKDSTMVVGVKLIDGGEIQNSMQCEVEEKDSTLVFSPDELKEYGFKDGSIYVSRSIVLNNETKAVFLERLSKGATTLYYYKDKNGKKFFLEKAGGPLVEVYKKAEGHRLYKDFLKTYTQDCNQVAEALKLVSYTKYSLSKFIDQYNECIKRPFTFTRYGLIIGYGFSEPRISKFCNELLKAAVFDYDHAINFGIFMDLPIAHSYFSLHPEIYFQKNAFSSHNSVNNSSNGVIIGTTVYDIIINTTSINLPVVVRYTYPTLKFRPFINIGCILSYNIRNTNEIYTTTISDDVIRLGDVDRSTIYSDKQIGYSVGSGLQYSIDFRKSIFLELRYNYLYELTLATYSSKSFQCILGFNF